MMDPSEVLHFIWGQDRAAHAFFDVRRWAALPDNAANMAHVVDRCALRPRVGAYSCWYYSRGEVEYLYMEGFAGNIFVECGALLVRIRALGRGAPGFAAGSAQATLRGFGLPL